MDAQDAQDKQHERLCHRSRPAWWSGGCWKWSKSLGAGLGKSVLEQRRWSNSRRWKLLPN